MESIRYYSGSTSDAENATEQNLIAIIDKAFTGWVPRETVSPDNADVTLIQCQTNPQRTDARRAN
ncbi:MAG: hypothetical protein ACRCTD_13500 [Beijerinckiaceae bacterium]